MSGGTTEFEIAPDGSFMAPLLLAYPYARTVGPVMSRFLTGLRDHRIEGTVGDDGRVHVPPAEFDPVTGTPLTEWRPVGTEGTVESWSWQAEPVEDQPFDRPFAWALVRLDGADSALLHVIDVPDPELVRTGMRVAVRWADEPSAAITDIACFEPVEG